jgi:hypothetical protein
LPDVRYRFIASDEMTKTTKAISSGLDDVAGKIGGPVGEALAKLSGGFDKLRGQGSVVKKTLAGLGGAAMGLGAIMVAEADKEKAATAGLKAAVEAAGESWEPYKKRVETASKTNEHFGYTSRETQLALARMTLATKNPQAAMQQMGLVVNIAAARHISLGDAAGIAAKLINGNVKTYKSFGVTLVGTKDAMQALEKAQREQTKAQKDAVTAQSKYEESLRKVRDAQQALADKTALANEDGKITLSESIRLRNAATKVADAQRESAAAHSALTVAQAKARTSAVAVAQAHKGVTSATKNSAAALAQVNKTVSGQAQSQANTYAGKWREIKAVTEDWVAHTGAQWGGKILAFGGVLSAFAQLFETQMVGAIGKAIAASWQFIAVNAKVTTAIIVDGAKQSAVWVAQTAKLIAQRTAMLAVSVATKAWAAAQWLLNAAMAANPLGLVIAGLVALAAGLIYAYKHSETFRNIVHAAMHGAQIAIGWVIDKGQALVNWFTGLPGKIAGMGKSLLDALTWPYRTAFHWIAVAWNNTVGGLSFSIPKWVPEIGGKGFSMPHVPENLPALAKGGIVTAPTVALIGEAGPEAVVPLGRGARGMGNTFVFHIQTLDPVTAGREVRKVLARFAQETGAA